MTHRNNKNSIKLTLNDKLVLERYSDTCIDFGGNCEMRLSDSRKPLTDGNPNTGHIGQTK